MPRGRNGVMGEQLAQVDNRDPFAPPVWRSPVYRTPEPVIFVVQLIRLVWRVLWFALTHPLAGCRRDAGRGRLAGPGLARRRRPGAGRCGGPGWVAGDPAGVVRPVRGGAGAGLVAVVVLPAPVEGRDDPGRARAGLPGPADAPGPGSGAPGRGGGPGAGRAGDRAGPGRLRRPVARTWRTRSARGCAGSATSRPAC